MDTNNSFFDSLPKDDPLFKEAVALVLSSGKASTTFIQRKLSIGYARAACLLDKMESMGIIGESNGARPRNIFVDKNDVDLNRLDKIVKIATYKQKLLKLKFFVKRLLKILSIALFLYLLKLIFGFEVVMLFGLGVIIEYLISDKSFYDGF